MSAAEKLKALHERSLVLEDIFKGKAEPDALDAVLRAAMALPQIVAVVEAAQQLADLLGDEESEWHWQGLAEALSALDEQLGDP